MLAKALELRTGMGEALRQYYEILLKRFGPQNWWPARSRLEVIVGAILTQNTSWRNVELALAGLRKDGLLNLKGLLDAPFGKLESCIRPAGYYRQKARTVKAFSRFLEDDFAGSLDNLFALPMAECRSRLLSIRGFGPETADAVLLYAGNFPTFVADTYTRRILSRHGLLPRGADYSLTQEVIHRNLQPDSNLYNELHALFVATGKTFCSARNPGCAACPLGPYLPSPNPLNLITNETESQRGSSLPVFQRGID
jgi:endonuclease-3 related protein